MPKKKIMKKMSETKNKVNHKTVNLFLRARGSVNRLKMIKNKLNKDGRTKAMATKMKMKCYLRRRKKLQYKKMNEKTP